MKSAHHYNLETSKLKTEVYFKYSENASNFSVHRTPEELKWIVLRAEPLLSLCAFSFLYKAHEPQSITWARLNGIGFLK